MLPVLPLLVGGALGTVLGFSLKKYFDENQSDIFERIENDTKNLIDRMDFSKLDSLKQSVYIIPQNVKTTFSKSLFS